jgi:hypothetical protein
MKNTDNYYHIDTFACRNIFLKQILTLIFHNSLSDLELLLQNHRVHDSNDVVSILSFKNNTSLGGRLIEYPWQYYLHTHHIFLW